MVDERKLFEDPISPAPEETNGTPADASSQKRVASKTNRDGAGKKGKRVAKRSASKRESDDTEAKRRRTHRPYPVVPYKEATQIGEAIFKFASGDKVRRLTLLEKLDRAPTSGPTKMLITNSGKYGITTGSYAAEFLELTPLGRVACDPASEPRARLDAQFKLAIDQIAPFKLIYETDVGKKLPAHEVMKDTLLDSRVEVDNPKECIDLFVVNIKDLGLLRTIASAETLVPIEQALDEMDTARPAATRAPTTASGTTDQHAKRPASSKWDSICFYITAIGDDGSAPRRHSDLFLSMLVEPALKELGLEVVRADKIAEPGMITTHILEHLKYSRLVVADLSLLNPNVFYEMALRHAVRLPIVQIIQKADRLPFDVNQVNSIIIDNTDIYTFTPKLETYRSEITTLARRALEDPEHVGNPISVFFPDFWK